MRRLIALTAWASALCLLANASAQTLPADLLQQKTLEKIETFDRQWDGVLGVAALDLTSGRMLSYHGNVQFPQASSIKIAILLEMFRQADAGALSLDDTVQVLPEYRVGGSGKLQEELKKGRTVRLTWRQLIDRMIIDSDNVATNVIIDKVGMGSVNRTLKQLGLVHTRLQRKMMDTAAVRRNDENISTPEDMVRLMQWLFSGRAATDSSCRKMLAILQQVKAGMRAAVPTAYAVAAKPGGVPGVRCETGIVYLDQHPFALSVMSAYNGDPGKNPVKRITEIVYDFFERLAHANAYGHRTAGRR